MRGEQEPAPAAAIASLRDCLHRQPRPLGQRRIVEVRVQVLILFDKQEHRTPRDFTDQPAHVLGGNASRRLEDRAESGFASGEIRQLPHARRTVRRTGKGGDHLGRDAQPHQPRVLILIHV